VTDALSVTRTLKLDDPAIVGVPDIDPVADKLRPEGSDPPDTAQVYGGDPPAALSGWE
jgi:hypothetical protein